MRALRAVDGARRNRRIEGREASVIRDREGQQINVANLPMPLHMPPSKASAIAQTLGIRPEQMIAFRAEARKARGRIGHRSA